MSQEFQTEDDDEQVMPASSRDDELSGAPTLGRYYEDAERELGPEAPHFDVVKRALSLWEEDVKAHATRHRMPGKDAP